MAKYEQNLVCFNTLGMDEPWSLESYLETGGYEAWKKILAGEITPETVVETVKRSGLRGRGGAGFPTGLKWSFVPKDSPKPRYLVCNCDESEPGTCKDRVLVERDPHSVIEGMALIAYAIGSDEGYIYARAEYPLAIHRLNVAIDQARERGFLGENLYTF